MEAVEQVIEEHQQADHYQFDEDLQCVSCYWLYSDVRRPALLPCHHKFCEPCLLEWAAKTCPFCRLRYTKEDIRIDGDYLRIVKTLLRTLGRIDRQALRIQVREQFKDLEPTFENIITLEESILVFYEAAIENTDWSLWASGASTILKSLAAGCYLFPATAAFSVTAMSVTTVIDLGQNLLCGQKQNEVYCKISEAIKKHDSILNKLEIQESFNRYHELKRLDYINLLKDGDARLVHHLNKNHTKFLSTSIHGMATLAAYKCLDVDSNVKTGLVSANTAGKIFVGLCAVAEWASFFNEMKNGRASKRQLEEKIAATKTTLSAFKTALRLSKENQI